MSRRRILCLEPWYGGSHRAFLDGWAAHSRHELVIEGLPPRHWKWRMRHAAVSFADRLREGYPPGEFDAVWASSMLSLAEFRGLAPARIARLPHVLYFHENQLTYPVRREDERDLQLAFTNLSSALAADAIWFNSAWHRHDLLAAIDRWMKRLPDHVPAHLGERISGRSRVHPPGLELPAKAPPPREPARPLHLVWAARWEHDKGPEVLERALDALPAGLPWRLSLLGQRFSHIPAPLTRILARYPERLLHRDGTPERSEYLAALADADVFLSTAHHEFFGIAAAEAIALGCVPLLPDRLAYPELLGAPEHEGAPWLYDGTAEGMARRLEEWIARRAVGEPLPGPKDTRERLLSLRWPEHAARLDDALEEALA